MRRRSLRRRARGDRMRVPAGCGAAVPVAGERGAGSVLAVAIIAASLVFAIAVLQTLGGLVAHQRASAAADAAALAAADTLSGRLGGDPCDQSAAAAALHDARLVSCERDGLEAEVTVAVDAGWIEVVERARAGPPSV